MDHLSISTFFGLNIGTSALNAAQQAEDVISNNISNANTTGYVQENAQLEEATPYPPIPSQDQPIMAGQMGEGVDVASVQRETSSFANQQNRSNMSSYEADNTYLTNLQQVESIVNEPSSDSMQHAVDQFFSSWQTLSTDPSNSAARQSVISEAQTLGQTFQTLSSQLENLQSNLSSTLTGEVNQVNGYAQQIATLNNQIVQVQQFGENPNQLLDQRGNLLDELSKLVNVSYAEQPNGAVTLSVGNTSLLSLTGGESNVTPLSTASLLAQPLVTQTTASEGSGSGVLANITGGDINGNAKSLAYVNGLLGNLNSFLGTFASSVNTIQESGYPLTGSQNAPALFSISSDTLGNTILSVENTFTTNDVAASSQANSSGNNTNTTAMIALQNTTQSSFSPSYAYDPTSNTYTNAAISGSATFDQSLGTIVSDLGVTTSAAQSQTTTSNALLQQSTNLRQSISGVNTNDQTAEMVQYQNSYDAAAKFISVYSSMLQTMISEL